MMDIKLKFFIIFFSFIQFSFIRTKNSLNYGYGFKVNLGRDWIIANDINLPFQNEKYFYTSSNQNNGLKEFNYPLRNIQTGNTKFLYIDFLIFLDYKIMKYINFRTGIGRKIINERFTSDVIFININYMEGVLIVVNDNIYVPLVLKIYPSSINNNFYLILGFDFIFILENSNYFSIHSSSKKKIQDPETGIMKNGYINKNISDEYNKILMNLKIGLEYELQFFVDILLFCEGNILLTGILKKNFFNNIRHCSLSLGYGINFAPLFHSIYENIAKIE